MDDAGQAAQEVLVAAQLRDAEVAGQQLAQRLVPGAVGLEDRAAQVLELGGRLLEVDELGRGEGLAVLVHHLDVLVAGDRPEAVAVAVGLVLPVQGILGAQRVEHPPRLVVDEVVEVGEVDVRQGYRGGLHQGS